MLIPWTSSSFAGVLLFICFVFIVAPVTLYAYPVFGTKRYVRSTGLPHRISTWGIPAPLPLQSYQQPQLRAQPHYGLSYASAPAYYTADPIVSYPYTQDYADDSYYAQEPSSFTGYPYYPTTGGVANGNLKYSVYQPVTPYYYGDTRQRYGYNYYGYDEANDPVDDLQEEIQQEEEREEREEALPIGQETWFEGGTASQRHAQDSTADVNAAFLQNLIMSQMYNDANSGRVMKHPAYVTSSYAAVDDGVQDGWMRDTGRNRNDRYYNIEEDLDDEDVRELKSLVKRNRTRGMTTNSANNWFPSVSSNKQHDHDQLWYGQKSTVDTTQRPQYYEPVWFPTDSAAWYDNSWSGSAYKRNVDFYEPLYQNIRSYNKKQESSEYGPWIAKGSINFSDRKGNGLIASNSINKISKTDKEKYNSLESQKSKDPTVNNVLTRHPTATTTPKPTASTVSPSSTEYTSTPVVEFDTRRGQKEVALLRPPSPARHPFTAIEMEKTMTRNRPTTHQASSVYDTIKQLLSMEQGLRKEADEDHARPQKRFVSNEESLVEELSGLKKLVA